MKNPISLLFNTMRKPDVASTIERPDDVIQRGLSFVGGTLMVKGGVQVDAVLSDVSLVSTDGKPIVLTALGKMHNCHIEGSDVLIMGDFSGEILATGDVEVTDTANFKGAIGAAGHVLLSPLASDAGEVKIKKFSPKVQDLVPVDAAHKELLEGNSRTPVAEPVEPAAVG